MGYMLAGAAIMLVGMLCGAVITIAARDTKADKPDPS